MNPRPLALFDIDKTLFDGFSLVPLLEEQASEGLIDGEVLAEAGTALQKYAAGEVDYETTVTHALEIYAHGLANKVYTEVLASTKSFYENSQGFFPFSRPLIKSLRRTHDVVLVTGEPQHVGEAVADVLGADSSLSSVYKIEDGHFTGAVETYLTSRHGKSAAINSLIAGKDMKGSLAFGDSEGDIEMLKLAEYPICLNPSKGLAEIAQELGWHIESPDTVEATVTRLIQGQ